MGLVVAELCPGDRQLFPDLSKLPLKFFHRGPCVIDRAGSLNSTKRVRPRLRRGDASPELGSIRKEVRTFLVQFIEALAPPAGFLGVVGDCGERGLELL